MLIRVRYFARMREAVARDMESLQLPSSVQTVGDLRRWMAERGEPWSAAFAHIRPLRAALDLQFVRDDAVLVDGCEVAFFPPVTGG